MMMGMPMPMGVRNENVGRALTEMRTLGDIVLNDVTTLFHKYSRSLDLDKCPQRLVCEFGSFMLPANFTQVPTAKTLTSYIVEQAVPKGKARKMLRQFEKAFWLGSAGSSQCSIYKCQPAFRMTSGDSTTSNEARSVRNNTRTTTTTTPPPPSPVYHQGEAHVETFEHPYESTGSQQYSDYQQQYQQHLVESANNQENDIQGASSNNYYKIFGTPTVKS